MSIDFASVRAITIPEGAVKMITTSDGTVLWTEPYVWKKYTVENKREYTESLGSMSNFASLQPYQSITAHSGYTFDKTTGTYTFTGTSTVMVNKYYMQYQQQPYVTINSKNYKVTNTIPSSTTLQLYGNLMGSTLRMVEGQGTYIEDVTATDADAYPDNGKHTDGYWYIKQ